MRILITAPSLDERENVSGISTIVRQIIDHGTFEYSHFAAGRRDGEPANALWLLKQTALPARFFARAYREEPDAVHINTALTTLSIWRDAALVRAAKLAGRRVVLAIHGGKFLMNEFESARLKAATRSMLRRADVVVVYSSLEEDALRRHWPDLKNIETLPNAIPFDEVPRAERSNAVPVMIYFGRMHESKGLHELIEASRILKNEGCDFELRAYGEGPIKEFFLDGMRNAIGEGFIYGGVVTGRDKWAKLSEADIFVLPSRYGEGLPMAMLEAMAVGCVVVAADVASVVSVVRDGVNGYTVPPQDTEELVRKLKHILDNPNAWSSIQQNAVATVRDNFAIDGYIEKLEGIYKSVAAG